MLKDIEFKKETLALFKLCGPIVISSLLMNSIGLVDQVMVGHLPNPDDLAIAGLSNTIYGLVWFPSFGVASALDTLAAQAHGAAHGQALTQATRTTIVFFSLVWTPLFIGVLLSGGWIAKALGQSASIVAGVEAYAGVLACGVWPNLMWLTAQKWLQAQARLKPAVAVGLLANIVNGSANYYFLYVGKWGVTGAAVATVLTRTLSLGVLLLFFPLTDLFTFDTAAFRSAFDSTSMKKFLRLAIPGAVMAGVEGWAFNVSLFFASTLGTVPLDAHILLSTVCGFIYMSFPFAIATAGSIRVGHSVGAAARASARDDEENEDEGLLHDTHAKIKEGKTAAVLAIGYGASFMLVSVLILLAVRHSIGSVFTADVEVAEQIGRLIPVAALYQVWDAIQGCVGGVLRGLALQKAAAVLNVVGFWVIGIPLGAGLTFGAGFGVAGLWWGYTGGISTVGLAGLAYCARIDWDARVKAAARSLDLAEEAVELEVVSQDEEE